MRIKLSATALASVLAISFLASSASALRSFEIRGAERGVERYGSVELNEVGLPAQLAIICNLTFLRTLNRAIPKTPGVAIGRTTGIAIDIPHCRHGVAWEEVESLVPLRDARSSDSSPRELGGGIRLYNVTGGTAGLWEMLYDGFQGTLPAITGINWHTTGVRFKIGLRFFGATATCLYVGNIYGITSTDAGGRIVASTINLPLTLLTTSDSLCPQRLTAAGTLRSSPQLTAALLA